MQFSDNYSFYSKIFLVGCISVFLWEHIARTKESQFKPSVVINWTADTLKNIFYNIGVGFSKLSSFLTYIKLDDLYKTAHDLLKPTFELIGSPLQTIKGYWDTALTYSYPITVTLGSLTLFATLMYLWYLFGHHVSFLHFWPMTKLPLKYL